MGKLNGIALYFLNQLIHFLWFFISVLSLNVTSQKSIPQIEFKSSYYVSLLPLHFLLRTGPDLELIYDCILIFVIICSMSGFDISQ